MKVFRLSSEPYHSLEDAFSGLGAARTGGRWNSSGVRVVYTSDSVALAAFERLVHTYTRKSLEGVWVYSYELDEKQIVSLQDLPPNWDRKPSPVDWHLSPFKPSQIAGNAWVQSRTSLALQLPSTVVPYGLNYFLNPYHPDFHLNSTSALGQFRFDQRLEAMVEAFDKSKR